MVELYLVGRDLTDDAIKKGKGLISSWAAISYKREEWWFFDAR